MDLHPSSAPPGSHGPHPPRPFEHLEQLEILSSLGSALGLRDAEPPQILKALHVHVRQLVPVHAAAFFLVDPATSEFTLQDCDPPENAAAVQAAVDSAITEGTFAWALRQNRPLFTRGDANGTTLVLHSLATRNRSLGMFAGIARDARIRESDAGTRLLSIILGQGAYALENAALNQRILRQNADLERMVRERTGQLEVALKAAQESSVVKSRFLANMSHEIRTPMNGILGLTELLESSPLDEEQRADLRTLRECGQNLLSILSDILDYSKIEAGKLALEHEPYDLRHVLTDLIRLMRPLSSAKNLALAVEVDELVPAVICGDQTRLRQVLLNLLGNAIKFTDTGSITLDVRPACGMESPGPGPMVLRFEVADTGIGIPAEAVEFLFKPFSQADASTTRVYGGTGLGLAISKSLCNLMGGDIWVTSEFGRGSRFAFDLPVEALSDLPLAEARPLRQGIDRRLAESFPLRILVVDDSSMNQLVACRILAKMGYSPGVASGGAEGIELALQDEYDLALVDLQMPGIDGYQVLRTLHERLPAARRPRIVAITANALREDRDQCMAAGFDDFLAKPFTSAELRAVILQTIPSTSVPASPS